MSKMLRHTRERLHKTFADTIYQLSLAEESRNQGARNISYVEEPREVSMARETLAYCESRFQNVQPSRELPSLRRRVLSLCALLHLVYNSISTYYMRRVMASAAESLDAIIEHTVFPIKAHSGANLTISDLSTIKDPGVWVNDEVINAQVSLLNDQSPFISFATTHFYSALLAKGPLGMERWLTPLLAKGKHTDIIAIPMNLGNVHWVACAIHLRLHVLLCFDSLSRMGVPAIRPLLLLLLVFADVFELTDEIMNERFVILFPNQLSTFRELDLEEHLSEEARLLRASRNAQGTLSLQSTCSSSIREATNATAPELDLISLSDSTSSATENNNLITNNTIDAPKHQSFCHKQRTISYYVSEDSCIPLRDSLLHKARASTAPNICTVDNLDHENQKEQISWASSVGLVTDLYTILTERDGYLCILREHLENSGLLMPSLTNDILPVDIRLAESTILELHSIYNIGPDVVFASEAVALSLGMPHQKNATDCGVYTIAFLKALIQQFGPGYPLVAQDTKKARSLIAAEICMQRLLSFPREVQYSNFLKPSAL